MSMSRYSIEREIGRGAMGVVYAAHDEVLDRDIALKELTFPMGADEHQRAEMYSRFAREAKAAARLQHPNIVQVYDVYSEGERRFIAMELLEGVSLADMLEGGRVSRVVAEQVLLQMLDALQAAHEAGVVHRDIKPDNIFVLNDGRVKVADFGIAKLDGLMDGVGATQMGTVLGTPGYMSPEQVQGIPVDHRSDIFSVGVIGVEMLSGNNPFLGNTTSSTLYNIVHETPPMASLEPAVAAVLSRALAKHPQERFSSANEMATSIRGGWSSGNSAPTSPTVSPGKSGRGAGAAIAAAVVIIGALAVGTLWFQATSSAPGTGGVPAQSAAGTGASTAVIPAAGVVAASPSAKPATKVAEPAPALTESELSGGMPLEHQSVAGSEGPATPFWGAFVYAAQDKNDADGYADGLENGRFPALVLNTGDYSTIGKPGVSIWVVCAGPYTSKAEAEQAASDLKSIGYKGAYAKKVDK